MPSPKASPEDSWKSELIRTVMRGGVPSILLVCILWWIADQAFPQIMAQQQQAIDAFNQGQNKIADVLLQNNKILTENQGLMRQNNKLLEDLEEGLDR